MLDPQAECPDCGAKLGARPDCRACGWKPTAAKAGAAPGAPDFVPPWKRPGFKPSTPEDVCPECGKKIREHIEEFKRAGERIVARAVTL